MSKSHGMSESSTYKCWCDMKARCYNKNGKDFRYYGGRGIKVCERWKNSFLNFLVDMGEKPEGLTLDRIDAEKNYTPSNCRWATRLEQANNQRRMKDMIGFRKLSSGRYQARIAYNNKTISLGTFVTKTEAVEARNRYREKIKLKITLTRTNSLC